MPVTLGQPLAPDLEILADLTRGIRDRGRWSNGGPLVAELERRLADSEGWQGVTATASGTSALTAALLSLDLPPGGEVVTSPLTFRATALAIEAAGLTPVFAAVDPESLTLDPDAVAQAIGARTAAVLPVHLFGLAVDPAVDAVAAERAVPVVHDAAHAFGFRDVAGRGTATAYSLHATKLLHTGEGGFVATDDPRIDQRVRHTVNFGIDGAGDRGRGLNAKLSEMAAAVGLATLPILPTEIAAREALRSTYAQAVARSSRLRAHAPGQARALVMDVVRCDPDERARIMQELSARGVTARAFPALCAPGERYADVTVVGTTTHATDLLSQSVIALPFHGGVTTEHAEAIAEVLAR